MAKSVPGKKEPKISGSQLLMWLEATSSGPRMGIPEVPAKLSRPMKRMRRMVRQKPAVSRYRQGRRPSPRTGKRSGKPGTGAGTPP